MIARSAQRRTLLLSLLAALALFFLYFFGLTRTGLLGPDEPRYAAIARAMAATGDWITPRLWGAAWFEKPPLLYWMTAVSFKLGLGPELAPRLPIALASVAFLVYFFTALRHEFGDRAAWYSATLLATSAGWLAYSHVAITDLPMAASFAGAMLALPFAGVRGGPRPALTAGVLLGLAVLAKGLVPLALFLPALWFLRHRIRDLALAFVSATLVAAPWYVLVTLHNGKPFLEEFFWKHHFGRFLNSELQHGQPVWFYLPILLAALFPWTPLLALLGNVRVYQDRRTQFLLAWLLWGLLFFSASRNKLPGYLLPLLPAAAALIGIALADSARVRSLLAACGALLCLVPALAGMLPQALLAGVSHAPFRLTWPWVIVGLAIAATCVLLEQRGHRDLAFALIACLMSVAVVGVVWRVYPELDRQLSGRAGAKQAAIVCLPPAMNRSQRYSIQYYLQRSLPDCK
jgi:4-amino-4-deoxy-L-arabinose transferase-like glycosyltransferase